MARLRSHPAGLRPATETNNKERSCRLSGENTYGTTRAVKCPGIAVKCLGFAVKCGRNRRQVRRNFATHTGGNPPVRGADRCREPDRIVVRVMVAEGVLGMPEKILAVDERDGALCSWLFRHDSRTNNPAGAFRRVRRGAIANYSISNPAPAVNANDARWPRPHAASSCAAPRTLTIRGPSRSPAHVPVRGSPDPWLAQALPDP